MTWRTDSLPEIVVHLASRPGHEAVRAAITDILRYGFQANLADIDHEVRMPEVRGRADTLFGATIFEFKSDLRREIGDVRAKMPDYLAERERQTGRRFLGVATDGASFLAVERRDGKLIELGSFETKADKPAALLTWLGPALNDRDDLPPEPVAVQRALGRDSFAFRHADAELRRLWALWRDNPEVALKRQLWDGLLCEVYGTAVGSDDLFLQHTYLTIVAKTIAARVLDLNPVDAESILSGRLLTEAGIFGAVESDFFDWVLKDHDGADLVLRLSRQASRFRLRDVESDVLKALYESLIDPAQRHDLGEYYTPDWLAAKVTRAAVTQPLTQRVLDPACGSGTFLFHAIRRLLATAEAAGWPRRKMVEACASQIQGLDIHPVAVIIARVTWLLALGQVVQDRGADLFVPVFLGDALQWNVDRVADLRVVQVPVPGDVPLAIPAGFAEDQAAFDSGLQALKEGLQKRTTQAHVEQLLKRIRGVSDADAHDMSLTYGRLLGLYLDGRDHIWPYILSNLRRPLFLSRPDRQADVLLGNPPWVAYRHLSASMKPRLREACQALDIWVGAQLATQQDICALFWARGAERYLRVGGRIAMVLPYAVLNRPAYAGVRRGQFVRAEVRIDEAWSFDEQVKPLFPVPACVLIGSRARAGDLPAEVTRYAGTLPRRDATEAEADKILRQRPDRWPPIPTLEGQSPYRAIFGQGATIVPRRFFIVETQRGGRLGEGGNRRRLRGRAGVQDKAPWKNLVPPAGAVENEFVRSLLLGESLAPFRILSSAMCVLPIVERRLLTAADAAFEGYRGLADWLRQIEALWDAHCTRDRAGEKNMTLLRQIDHMRKLTAQLPTPGTRVIYAASGTLPAAVLTNDTTLLVEHAAYWAPVRSMEEGRYLTAILNSEAARKLVEDLQAKGQGGARHFDNLIWELPIAAYDRTNKLHRSLASAAKKAEAVAAATPITDKQYFTSQRRAIRDALHASGLAAEMNHLVTTLLSTRLP